MTKFKFVPFSNEGEWPGRGEPGYRSPLDTLFKKNQSAADDTSDNDLEADGEPTGTEEYDEFVLSSADLPSVIGGDEESLDQFEATEERQDEELDWEDQEDLEQDILLTLTNLEAAPVVKDPIGFYLSQMKAPLLTREEELDLGYRIVHGKERLLSTLFNSDVVALSAVGLMREALVGRDDETGRARDHKASPERERFNSVVTFERDGVDGKGGQSGAIRRMDVNLKTVERLLGALQDKTAEFENLRGVAAQDTGALALEIQRTRGKIATILIETEFRRNIITKLIEEFLKAAESPAEYWSTTGVAMVRGLRSRLEMQGEVSATFTSREHLMMFGEAATELAKRVADIKLIVADYEGARQEMASRNLKLVVSIAKKYAKNPEQLKDRMQDGNRGLMIAVDNWDPSRGFKFSTYATWWIRQCVSKNQFEDWGILPRKVSQQPLFKSVREGQDSFVQKHGREADAAELARAINRSVEDVQMAMASLACVWSLDAPIGQSDSGRVNTLRDVLSPGEVDYEEGIRSKEVRELLTRRVGGLTVREAEVLRLRYGILSEDEHERYLKEFNLKSRGGLTLQEIGDLIKVTRERVRQIETKAKKKLEQVLKPMESKY